MLPPESVSQRLLIREALDSAKTELEQRDQIKSGDKWGVYGSTLRDYGRNFYPVLGHDSIERLVANVDDLTVIDFMAPTDTIAELITSLPNTNSSLGIAVTRDDQRDDDQTKRDESLNIHQIHGNVTDQAVWSEIYGKLGKRKASLILERGLGAINPKYIPANKRLYEIAIRKCWDILDPNGGIILAQLHDDISLANAEIDIDAWKRLAQDEGIDIRCFTYKTPPRNDSGAEARTLSGIQTLLYIKRHPDSPSRFPTLRVN